MKTFKQFINEQGVFYNPNFSNIPKKREMPLSSEKIPYGDTQRKSAVSDLYSQSKSGSLASAAERAKEVDEPIRSGQKTPFIHPSSPEARHFDNPSKLTAKDSEEGFGPDNRENRI